MQRFQEILAAYSALDQALVSEIAQAQLALDLKRIARLEDRQVLNDHAYFVLLFGQFEAGLNDRCAAAIRMRQQDSDWSRRRGWDIYNPNDPRMSGLSFQDRVALVADKQGSVFPRIMRYYDTRNLAAHGKFRPTDLDIPTVAAELQTLFGQLAP